MKPQIKKKNILFNRFIKLIEESHDTLTEQFMNDLLKNPETEAYRNVDWDIIYRSSDTIYRDLSQWISREFSKEQVRERYIKLGRERYEMGIPFPQVFKGLVLQRRHLWLFVMDKLYDDKTAYMEALELNNRVTLYFDRAMLYTLQAYQTILSDRMR